MRRLIVFTLLALCACTPAQERAWLRWFHREPRAAVDWAVDDCGALCTDDWDGDGLVEPEPAGVVAAPSETTSADWSDGTVTETDAGIADFGKWEPILECESGGNWYIDSTFDGGLQFHPDTWDGYGGDEYADYAWGAEPWEQIAIAERVLDGQGWNAWPTCARNAGTLTVGAVPDRRMSLRATPLGPGTASSSSASSEHPQGDQQDQSDQRQEHRLIASHTHQDGVYRPVTPQRM